MKKEISFHGVKQASKFSMNVLESLWEHVMTEALVSCWPHLDLPRGGYNASTKALLASKLVVLSLFCRPSIQDTGFFQKTWNLLNSVSKRALFL